MGKIKIAKQSLVKKDIKQYMEKGRILVNGSVVIDTIFEKEFFGGTGANIAYGLGKLKASPLLFSLAGKDFNLNYAKHLKKVGVDVRVHIDKTEKTANFSCVIDAQGEEESKIWEANVYKNISKVSLLKTINQKELEKITIAIFSSGTMESILKHMSEFKEIAPNAIVIFDPGREINDFSKKTLEKCLNLCDIFIVNEMEYKEAKKILKKDPRKFIKQKIIIKTLGAKGSEIFQNGETTKVPVIKPKRVLDTTGAGDAYRAGLIFGLFQGKTLAQSCALGAKVAAKCVEHLGCQKYKLIHK